MSFEDITRQLEATDRMLCRAKELFEAGQLGKAERAYKKILNDVVELYGPESLKTCTCLSELAEIAYAQESYAEVITLLEQVIITNCRTSILTNEQMLSIHFKLAKAFEKSNNIHEAYGVYSDLLKKSQQVLGPNAPFTRRVRESLVALLRRNSRKLPIAEKVLESLGENHVVKSQFSTSQNLKASFAKESQSHRSMQSGLQSVELPALRRNWGRSLTLALACIFSLGFLVFGVIEPRVRSDNPQKPSANAFEATAVPSVHGVASGNNLKPGFYAATDGITTLNVAENGEAVLVTGGASKVVSVNKIGAEVYATDKTSKAVFRYSDHALIDEQGTKLFKAGAPELSTVQVIKNVAVTLNRYYQAYGHYPQTQTELQSLEQHIAYMNPLNDRPAFPRLMTVIERRGSSSMTLDEYSNANLITSKLMNLNGSMGEPCGVELYVTPYSSTGETVVIRGYDRSGSLLPCSLAGRCYNLVLVAGSVR